jgi:hypothetical protein
MNFMGYPGRLILHTLCAAIFGCAYVAMAVPAVLPAMKDGSVRSLTAFQTTDTYLFACAEMTDGSQLLLDVFEALPTHKRIGVVIQENNAFSAVLGWLIAYFGWPREIKLIPNPEAGPSQKNEPIDPASFTAIFFCGVTPPARLGPGIRLGSNLVFVPIPETAVPRQP